MSLGQLLVLHLMAGLGVATAVYLSARARRPGELWFQVASAVVFWPLYLPILLSQRARERREVEPEGGAAPPSDELARAISRVDGELEAALQSLDGWAEDVLARENDRLHELRTAWTAQAQRIREMDRLLGRPEYAEATEDVLPSTCPPPVSARLRTSQQVIRQNIERLRQVRQRTLQDLLGTLAWVRELVSMIHLAKFTGAPASRAEELVAQIAAAVEGLSALTWQEDAPVPTGPDGSLILRSTSAVVGR
jgi:hypothetical protein